MMHPIGERKNDHIEICNTQSVESSDQRNGLERFELRPCALPTIKESDLSTKTTFLGRTFDWPILITGMTGGVEKGSLINERLAQSAVDSNIPMGVGSQRIALEHSELESIFVLKKKFPKLFLIGNIGCGQLKEKNFLDLCKRSIEMINADALAIHINILQELVQEEGDRDFSQVIERIAEVCAKVSTPIIAKEVGCGLDVETVSKLVEAGVAAADVGGKGGTSWSYIEGLRAKNPVTRRLGEAFRDWGIPTAVALQNVRERFKTLPVIATGGIRSGLDIAKAVGLGANLAGIGLPFLRAALVGEDSLHQEFEFLTRGLKIAMVCTNSANLSQLQEVTTVRG